MDQVQELAVLKLFNSIPECVLPGLVDPNKFTIQVCNAKQVQRDTEETFNFIDLLPELKIRFVPVGDITADPDQSILIPPTGWRDFRFNRNDGAIFTGQVKQADINLASQDIGDNLPGFLTFIWRVNIQDTPAQQFLTRIAQPVQNHLIDLHDIRLTVKHKYKISQGVKKTLQLLLTLPELLLGKEPGNHIPKLAAQSFYPVALRIRNPVSVMGSQVNAGNNHSLHNDRDRCNTPQPFFKKGRFPGFRHLEKLFVNGVPLHDKLMLFRSSLYQAGMVDKCIRKTLMRSQNQVSARPVRQVDTTAVHIHDQQRQVQKDGE